MHETIHEAKPLLREGLEKMALNATWRAFQAILGVVQHYLAHFFDGFCRFLQVFRLCARFGCEIGRCRAT